MFSFISCSVRRLVLLLSSCLGLGMLATAEKLPADLKWQTNTTAPVFENYTPQKGGTLVAHLSSYPLTFRLYGPNSNSGGFVGYNRRYAFLSLVNRHPSTQEFTPELATHWFVSADNTTVYYKLDPDARWSDGEKITANDYVFTDQMYRSEHLKAPYYKSYQEKNFASITAIDEHTLKIVLTKPSWRALDISNLVPSPRHAITLDKDWIKKYQWRPNVVPGPYVLSKFKKGKSVEFKRIKDWWGADKRYFRDRFHFDRIRLNVIKEDNVAYELFKKGKLSYFTLSPIQWEKKTDIDAIKRGYIIKQRFFYDRPSGLSGLFFNTQMEPWSDPKLRIALAHAFDFETINANVFYNLYTRKEHFFDIGPPYRNPAQKTYPFDLAKAQEILENSGWKRSNSASTIREKDGKPLSLKVFFAAELYKEPLTLFQEAAAKIGVDLQLEFRDGATFFRGINERVFPAFLVTFGSGTFPSPRQFLHTENLKKNTNNLFMYGTPQIDEWIETYEFNLNEEKRIEAIYNIEQAMHEVTPVIYLSKPSSALIVRQRHIQGPPEFIYKHKIDFDLWYQDQEEATKVKKARSAKESLPVPPVEQDPYGVRK